MQILIDFVKKHVVVISIIIFIIVCVCSFLFSDACYSKNIQRTCNTEICLSEGCLVWDDSLKRCGLPEALKKERERLGVEDSIKRWLDSIPVFQDSLEKKEKRNKTLNEKKRNLENQNSILERKIKKLEDLLKSCAKDSASGGEE